MLFLKNLFSWFQIISRNMNIDQELYNRQIYVLGEQAMNKLATASILLNGAGGLGIEIAKNIVLAGINSLTLMDDSICNDFDIGTQFFITQDHVNKKCNRAEASLNSLKELNPYVKIEVVNKNINKYYKNDRENCLMFLKCFKCVIFTEVELENAIEINEYCRLNDIMFLMADCYGLMSWSFSDFGDLFDIVDHDGEELKEQFIGDITQCDTPIVSTLDDRFHNLENDNSIFLNEIEGMTELNNQTFKVKIINPTKFVLIDCNTNKYNKYLRGGVFKQVKQVKKIKFKSLKEELYNPNLIISNYAKPFHPYYIHASLLAIHNTFGINQMLEFSCLATKYFNQILSNAKILNEDNNNFIENFFNIVYATKKGKFPSLSAIFGGIVAQEALKSLTNKFTPIQQWLHLDCLELYEHEKATLNIENVLKNDRYDCLRICLGGEETLEKLFNTKLFMVGCGAIGCEMLKNYALLGVGCKDGLITITDNDLIEKSNLNRQFLFRPRDIQQSKSLIARAATQKINPDIKIKAFEEKVCPQTELNVFPDMFFEKQDICVNALDNIEARRYMDSRCVTNQKPLLESGTLGAKGHVQVIIPHMTESYNTHRDPQDQEIPYCTLKSFPSSIEHCIQWARDKFESSYTIKPSMYLKFFNENQSLEKLIRILDTEENTVIDGSVQVAKILRDYCINWTDCIKLARIKFEKYFSNKAKNLLYNFPLNHLVDDGTPFWKLPRRPPNPIKFDSNNELHIRFIQYCARLYAEVYHVAISNENIVQILDNFEKSVPIWHPSAKRIETDEKKKKEEMNKISIQNLEYDNKKCAEIIKEAIDKYKSKEIPKLDTLHFEKDNILNGHIDFIYAASNLRASMYHIENADWLQVKKIAGRIVPAIATTTSCIAGFVSIEMIKLIKNEKKIESYNNIFLNLALSLYVLSEPGICNKTHVTPNCCVTLWDKWIIKGNAEFTLRNFIDKVKENYKLTVSSVLYGAKAVYMPVMPGHAKRVNETMMKLIKGSSIVALESEYADLTLTYMECDDIDNGNANNLCPPVRYYFL